MSGAVLGGRGGEVDEPETSDIASELSVSSLVTSSCTTASVIGLSEKIAADGALRPAD